MKDKINTTDPAEVRKWEERIYISLEGGKPYMFGATGEVSKNSPFGVWSQHCGNTYEYAKEKVEKWNKENPELAINVDDIRPIYDTPQYHKSLDGLFRVLRKLATNHGIQWYQDGIQFIGSDYRVICTLKNGGETVSMENGDTPEDAIFSAICQYLRKYYPTVGEEQERIEREAK